MEEYKKRMALVSELMDIMWELNDAGKKNQALTLASAIDELKLDYYEEAKKANLKKYGDTSTRLLSRTT